MFPGGAVEILESGRGMDWVVVDGSETGMAGVESVGAEGAEAPCSTVALKSVYSCCHFAGVASLGLPYFWKSVSRVLLRIVVDQYLHQVFRLISFSSSRELQGPCPIFEDTDLVP